MSKSEDAKLTINVENVVASTSVGRKLELNEILNVLEDAEYNKDKFPGIVYRTKEPKTAALIFGSGKIVCTGARSIKDVEGGLKIVFEKLSKLYEEINPNPIIKIQNIVASADLKTPLNLSAIAIGLGLENIEYEPEQFPGLVYRLKNPKVVMLLFGSGKLVITGGKEVIDVEKAVEKIVNELEELGLI